MQAVNTREVSLGSHETRVPHMRPRVVTAAAAAATPAAAIAAAAPAAAAAATVAVVTAATTTAAAIAVGAQVVLWPNLLFVPPTPALTLPLLLPSTALL